MSKWNSAGWDNAEEQIKASGGFTRDFFLKENDEATIRILDEEPVNIRDHFVKGKGWYTCSIEDCVLCESGNKPTSHFVFNVLDKREWTDKGGTAHTNEVKLWRVGVKILRLLGKKQARKGPINSYDITVSRLGSGTSTTYDIDVEDSTIGSDAAVPEGQELYDREEVLKPKERSELLGLLNGEEEPSNSFSESAVPWKR
jgi:hypothetical protein